MAILSVDLGIAYFEHELFDQSHRLVLTGQCRSTRHGVVVDDICLWLTGTCFLAAVDLVAARLSTRSGYTALPSCCQGPEGTRLVIHQLRKSLRSVLPEPGLISNDGKTRYKLHIAPSRMAIDPTFFELPVPSFVHPETMAAFQFETQQNPD